VEVLKFLACIQAEAEADFDIRLSIDSKKPPRNTIFLWLTLGHLDLHVHLKVLFKKTLAVEV
jgi:hypothetical protein